MGENTAGYFEEPAPEVIHNYEQRGDGKWYWIGGGNDPVPVPGISPAVEDGLMAELDRIEAENIKDRFVPGNEAVGDLTSDEKGSGARFNTGKPPMQYIPFEQQLFVFKRYFDERPECEYLYSLVISLSDFEKGRDSALLAIMRNLEITDLHAAAYVWQYGAEKYNAWNWAKGMPWSVPLACISRHIQAILVEREELDAESQCEHWGHIVCNLLMLDHYSRYYRAGDDRPPARIFEVES